jgi:hypothetical protein
MLEQQQSQLVSGLQEMYRRLQTAGVWNGESLKDSNNGQPLTHDILKSLGLLEPKHDGSGEMEMFEEDPSKLQSRLLSEGAGFAARRSSLSSDSDHSQHESIHSQRQSQAFSSFDVKPQLFRESFQFSAPNSPGERQSPLPHSRLSQHQQAQLSPARTSSPLSHESQLYQDWSFSSQNAPRTTIQSTYMTTQSPTFDNQSTASMSDMSFGNWDSTTISYDLGMAGLYQNPLSQDFLPKVQQDFNLGMTPLDPMIDLEFSQFVQVSS